MPNLREGRRMIRDYVMTESHCLHDGTAPDSVAIVSHVAYGSIRMESVFMGLARDWG